MERVSARALGFFAIDNPVPLVRLESWHFLPITAITISNSNNNLMSTPSEYVRSLIRDDQQKIEDEERLEQMLSEGLRSGPGTTIRSKADWAKFWKKIDAGIQANHNKHRP